MAVCKLHQRGDALDYTPGSAKSAGNVVVQDSLVGIVIADIAASGAQATGSLAITGVYLVPKSNSQAFVAGASVYWDVADDQANADTGNPFMGKAAYAAAETDTEMYVALGTMQSGLSIARSVLVEDALQPYDVMPVLKGADGADLALSETAGDFFKNIGTNQDLIDGEATVNETEASIGIFTFTLPPEYVAGGDIKIRAAAGVVLAGDAALTSATIDFEAYKQATDGTVGSDLVATAATAITTTIANKDFTVTATGLVAGDKLNIKMTTSVVEEAGGTGAANSRITRLQMLCDIKG